MTAKDAVYFSIIALTAVVFYWTGFYGGFNATLRILRRQEEEEERRAVDFEPAGQLMPPMAMGRGGEGLSLEGVPARVSHPAHGSGSMAQGGLGLPASNVYFGRN
ncbi:MAG TPA: hypothetical protein DCM86_20155 [Verrucomicrobiales bacterium]|nr:hypothetical protein [Verrucomicrobiales bacterium]